MLKSPKHSGNRGFTLVELLVVIGIIAILVGILLPAVVRAREQSKSVVCQTQLREIFQATLLYAHDNRDAFPGPSVTGNWDYRRAPGDRTPNDPSALPECFGLAAVLHGIQFGDDLRKGLGRPRYLEGRSAVWICPAADDQLRTYNNTYGFNGTQPLLETNSYNPDGSVKEYAWVTTARRAKKTGQLWVGDATTLLPGLTGFRGKFSAGYSVASSRSPFFPHKGPGRKRYVNKIFLDGHYDRQYNQ